MLGRELFFWATARHYFLLFKLYFAYACYFLVFVLE